MACKNRWFAKLPAKLYEIIPKSIDELNLSDINKEVIGSSILRQIYGLESTLNGGDFAGCKTICQILLDITWEKLNTGYWKDVDMNWRYLYYDVSVVKALCECSINNKEEKTDFSDAIKTCDMGLLMGAPFKSNYLTSLVSQLHKLQSDLNVSPLSVNAKQNVSYASDVSASLVATDGIVGNVQPYCNIQKDSEVNIDSLEYEPTLKRTKTSQYSHNTSQVPRVHCPSLENFKHSFMDKEEPVIIVGAIDYWPSFNERKWNLDYLKQIAGHRTVPIEIGSKYTEDNWSQSLMTINDFIDKYIKVPCVSQKVGYLAQHQLFDQIPELQNDISVPTYCCLGENNEVDINAWFGPKGTISPLHTDPKHNFLAQVVGTKYLTLFGADQTQYLYPHDGMLNNTSQVDVETPDYVRFPLFKESACLECLLKPREMLYIPPKCWHYVRSLSLSFSVSFWWE